MAKTKVQTVWMVRCDGATTTINAPYLSAARDKAHTYFGELLGYAAAYEAEILVRGLWYKIKDIDGNNEIMVNAHPTIPENLPSTGAPVYGTPEKSGSAIVNEMLAELEALPEPKSSGSDVYRSPRASGVADTPEPLPINKYTVHLSRKMSASTQTHSYVYNAAGFYTERVADSGEKLFFFDAHRQVEAMFLPGTWLAVTTSAFADGRLE